VNLFDIVNKKVQLSNLEKKTLEPDFWNDNKESGKVLSEIKTLKDTVSNYTKAESELINIIEMTELVMLEFDEELARKRQQEEYNVAHGFMSKEERTVLQNMGAIPKPNTNRVECPYCHSNDVSKISTFGRAASVGIFGLASKKIGKQWHCNHCKSDF